MSSIKLLKKKVKRMVLAVLDQGDGIMENDSRNADAADKIMDEAVDYLDEMMVKINAAKNKTDFRAIELEVNKREMEFKKKLNALN